MEESAESHIILLHSAAARAFIIECRDRRKTSAISLRVRTLNLDGNGTATTRARNCCKNRSANGDGHESDQEATGDDGLIHGEEVQDAAESLKVEIGDSERGSKEDASNQTSDTNASQGADHSIDDSSVRDLAIDVGAVGASDALIVLVDGLSQAADSDGGRLGVVCKCSVLDDDRIGRACHFGKDILKANVVVGSDIHDLFHRDVKLVGLRNVLVELRGEQVLLLGRLGVEFEVSSKDEIEDLGNVLGLL